MNLFKDLDVPNNQKEEIALLLKHPGIRIERITSKGQSSPEGFWYDQAEHEWVVLLKGKGIVEFGDGRKVELFPGDYLHIPAHTKHRVDYTTSDELTLWLAIFYP